MLSHFIKHYKRYGLLAILIALGTVYLLKFAFKTTFPELPEGNYVGTISGFSSEQLLWHVKSINGTAPQITIFDRRFSPQILEGGMIQQGNGLRFKLIGNQTGDQTYAGELNGVTEKLNAKWILKKINVEKIADPSWAEVLSEQSVLRSVEFKAMKLTQEVAAQQAEITRLNDTLFRGDDLKKRAEEKYLTEQARLLNLGETFNSEQERLLDESVSYDLALKFSSYGRLVQLARESLVRETQLTDTSAESVPEAQGNDDIVSRGEEILRLRKLIEEEKEKIEQLASGVAGRNAKPIQNNPSYLDDE